MWNVWLMPRLQPPWSVCLEVLYWVCAEGRALYFLWLLCLCVCSWCAVVGITTLLSLASHYFPNKLLLLCLRHRLRELASGGGADSGRRTGPAFRLLPEDGGRQSVDGHQIQANLQLLSACLHHLTLPTAPSGPPPPAPPSSSSSTFFSSSSSSAQAPGSRSRQGLLSTSLEVREMAEMAQLLIAVISSLASRLGPDVEGEGPADGSSGAASPGPAGSAQSDVTPSVPPAEPPQAGPPPPPPAAAARASLLEPRESEGERGDARQGVVEDAGARAREPGPRGTSLAEGVYDWLLDQVAVVLLNALGPVLVDPLEKAGPVQRGGEDDVRGGEDDVGRGGETSDEA